jgi:hypothetical protein
MPSVFRASPQQIFICQGLKEKLCKPAFALFSVEHRANVGNVGAARV